MTEANPGRRLPPPSLLPPGACAVCGGIGLVPQLLGPGEVELEACLACRGGKGKPGRRR